MKGSAGFGLTGRCLILCWILPALSVAAIAQSSPAPKPTAEDAHAAGSLAPANKAAPVFTPSGVQGSIAPSGYSAAASAEDASLVMHHATDLNEDDLASFFAAGSVPDCSQQAHLAAAARSAPDSFDANHALGAFYLYHQNSSLSLPYLQQAARIQPNDLENTRELALASIGVKQYAEAIAALMPLGEQDASATRVLAMAYQASGDAAKAAASFQRASELDASEANQFVNGMSLIRLGAARPAAALFAKATAAHPESARLWMGLGIAQDLQQQKAEAARSLLQATDADPNYLASYAFLATLSGSTPEFDAEIRKRLSAVAAAHPENAEAHFNYGLALWKQRSGGPDAALTAEAEKQLKMATGKDPRMAQAHFQLGVLYADSNQLPEAIQELEAAARYEPDNASAHYRLSQAYRKEKQTVKADEELRKFKALSAGQPEMGTGMAEPERLPMPAVSTAGRSTRCL